MGGGETVHVSPGGNSDQAVVFIILLVSDGVSIAQQVETATEAIVGIFLRGGGVAI